jgi:hypothetical protein
VGSTPTTRSHPVSARDSGITSDALVITIISAIAVLILLVTADYLQKKRLSGKRTEEWRPESAELIDPK